MPEVKLRTLHHRLRDAVALLEERLGKERGSATRIYHMGTEMENRMLKTVEDPVAGTVEYREFPPDVKEKLLRILKDAGIYAVKDVIYHVPHREDPLPERHIVIKLPVKEPLERHNIIVTIKDDGKHETSVQADLFIPLPEEINLRAEVEPLRAEVRSGDGNVKESIISAFKEAEEHVLRLNGGKGFPYSYNISIGTKKGKHPFSFSVGRSVRGTRITIHYIPYREGHLDADVSAISKNMAEIAKKILEAHEKLLYTLRKAS